MSQRGFSLLEALVALTILAGAVMALFAWMGNSLTQLNRAEIYVDAEPALQSAMSYLKLQDLAARPQGTLSSGGVEVSWQATPIEQDHPGVAGSNFILSLFQVELTIRKGARSLPPLTTRVVNYRLIPGAAEAQNGF